jgi:hypothetical protein
LTGKTGPMGCQPSHPPDISSPTKAPVPEDFSIC